MKKFKQSFGVTGSPAQIAAFKEYAEGLGWEYECHENNGAMYFVGADRLFGWECVGKFWKCCPDGLNNSTTFHLPAQLPEAIAAATPEEIEDGSAMLDTKIDAAIAHATPTPTLIPFDLDKAKAGNIVRKDGKVAVDWHLFAETNEYPAMLVVLFDNEPPSGYNEYGNSLTNLPLFMLPDVKVVYRNVYNDTHISNALDSIEICKIQSRPNPLCVLAFTTTNGVTTVSIAHHYNQ